MQRYSLRFRIFLFFVFQALGSTAVVLIALWFGHHRSDANGATSGFILAATLSAFGLVGLTAGIWLLFDENIARPIEALAARLRVRAHAQVETPVSAEEARYLGDLGPAAQAVSDALNRTAMDSAMQVSRETERLARERERLTALLTEIPVAMILVNASDQIVLYDGQAAEVLAQLGVPRLNAPIGDYFSADCLTDARARLHRSGREVSFTACGRTGAQRFEARMRPMDGGGYMLMIDEEELTLSPGASRPLVYDFDLLDRGASRSTEDLPLRALTYAVFDTETTGLLPHKDEIVQIGALRVVNGRIVPGEVIDQLVNPGRPIPASASKVHRVTDAMVQGAPDIASAGARFHEFAKGSVIVAHNAPFDMAFLRRHAQRMGVEWDNPILDTVLLSAVLFGTNETHTLDALCDRLGVALPAMLRHTALGDAQATAEVFVRMLPLLEAQGLSTFGEVIAETRRHGRLLEDLN